VSTCIRTVLIARRPRQGWWRMMGGDRCEITLVRQLWPWSDSRFRRFATLITRSSSTLNARRPLRTCNFWSAKKPVRPVAYYANAQILTAATKPDRVAGQLALSADPTRRQFRRPKTRTSARIKSPSPRASHTRRVTGGGYVFPMTATGIIIPAHAAPDGRVSRQRKSVPDVGIRRVSPTGDRLWNESR